MFLLREIDAATGNETCRAVVELLLELEQEGEELCKISRITTQAESRAGRKTIWLQASALLVTFYPSTCRNQEWVVQQVNESQGKSLLHNTSAKKLEAGKRLTPAADFLMPHLNVWSQKQGEGIGQRRGGRGHTFPSR